LFFQKLYQRKRLLAGRFLASVKPVAYGLTLDSDEAQQVYTGASYSIYEKLVDSHPDRVVIKAATGSGSTTLTFTAAKGLFMGLFKFLYLMIWTSGLEVVFDSTTNADLNQTIVRAKRLSQLEPPAGVLKKNTFSVVFHI
jgi:hypothetical protein